MKSLLNIKTKDHIEIKNVIKCGLRSHTSRLCRYMVSLILFTLSVFTLKAQPVVSVDLFEIFEIEARVRNGNTGFEGVLYTPGTPGPGTPSPLEMDPSGAPIWNTNGNVYGDMHSFLLTYEKATGKTTWNIDFNRDGDYSDPQESVSNTNATLAGKGFRYVNLWAQGSSTGLTASVNGFTINGHPMGSFSSNSVTATSILFKETQGFFGDITISGQVSFSGNGGQESPRIWVRLGEIDNGPAINNCPEDIDNNGLINTDDLLLFLAKFGVACPSPGCPEDVDNNGTVNTDDLLQLLAKFGTLCPVTDTEGNVYNVVQIGNQVWMAENLRTLPSVVGAAIGSTTTPYYYVYDYNGTDVNAAKATANYTTYGVLYNWPAAMAGSASSTANPSSVKGVCPTGWHLPSDAEWTQLTDYLGGENVAGGKLKEIGTTHWADPNTGATNETGFGALPVGGRNDDGTFILIGEYGYWWSTTDLAEFAWHRNMSYDNSVANRDFVGKEIGLPVRCVRD